MQRYWYDPKKIITIERTNFTMFWVIKQQQIVG